MNYGILHNRRPTKADAAGGRNPLLNDPRMREMAKQMGLEPKDFGSQAMELWKTLDAMAENDPSAYQSFISDQLKDGPPPRSGDSTSTLRAFNPMPGFVVKCAMMGSVKQQVRELKLFLNLCFHEIVDLPKNPHSGRDVPRDTHAVPTTSNLQIPLVIGALREIKDFNGAPCRAIDVVFHPWVYERCQWDAKFKRDILSLAISWVQQDAKITLVSPLGKFIKSAYKGGVMVGNEIITARFPIEPEQQQTRTLDVKIHAQDDDDPPRAGDLATASPSSQSPVKKITMASPSDLLKKLNDVGETDHHADEFLIASSGQIHGQQITAPSTKLKTPEANAAPAKKLIEVIEPKPDNQKEHRKSTSTKKKSPVVKRGFLNATKKPLYPSGSSEGRPASAYVNLLSRSKVVDLSADAQHKKEHQASAQRQHDDISSLMGVETPSAKTVASINSTTTSQEEQDFGDYEFEQLCMEADPELAPSNASHAIDPTAAQAVFGDHLDAFAKLLSSQSG